MGNIKLTNGEITPDRRKNGSRLRLDVQDWVKIFITVGTLAFMIVSGWTSVRLTLEQQAGILSQNIKDVAENKIVSRDNKKDIEFLQKTYTKIDNKLDKLIESK
uniref:Uncharacterized protein n=1 Tax=viral metagenome TaxID=1070528 RepID=A0A6M3KPZ2_9ZZZZ